MEGVLMVIKAWALMGTGLHLYRRFFERVSRPEPEFEAWCRQAQLVAAVHGAASTLPRIEASLRELLGKQQRVVATLGGWPWTNYGLSVRISRSEDALTLVTVRGELLRTHGAPPPSLVSILCALSDEYPELQALWVCPGAVYKQGPNEAPHGWLLEPGPERKARWGACAADPAWLAARETPCPNAQAGAGTSPKFLKFPAEC